MLLWENKFEKVKKKLDDKNIFEDLFKLIFKSEKSVFYITNVCKLQEDY